VMRSVVVLIPAAGGSRDSLGRLSNFPAALALVSGAPIICLILEELIAMGLHDFRIGVSEDYIEDFRYVTRKFNRTALIRLLPTDVKGSPVDTIRILSDSLPPNSSVLVNLGDTYCQWDLTDFQSHSVAILMHPVSDSERWSMATADEIGYVTEIFEKGSTPKAALGICGIYWWRDSQLFIDALKQVDLGSEISSILEKTNSQIFSKVPTMWIDSDRQDILENSRLSMVQARSFNSITVDPYSGILIKKSTNASKLSREIAYYQNLPSNLKSFFPRMFNFVHSETNPIQELEYYSYPTLAEVYVYVSAPKFVWEKILHKLGRVVFESFASFPEDVESTNLEEIFIEKCVFRIPSLLDASSFPNSLLQESDLFINGNRYQGLNSLLEGSRRILKSIQSPSTIIHGDFCLSNIMCDVNSTNIKLIDPRGGFETTSCFGPQIYDVAKLGHSILGKYDLITADQFSLESEDPSSATYFLNIHTRDCHLMVEDLFYSHFVCDRYEPRLLKLVSGLILLAIPVYHLETPNRAIALFLQGIRMVSDALEEFE